MGFHEQRRYAAPDAAIATAIIPSGDYKRAGGFAGLRRLIRECGGAPEAMLRRRGVDPRSLDDSEGYVCYSDMIAVLEDCAAELDQPFFGFELAQRQNADVIGPPAALLLAAPNVAEGLKLVERYFLIHAPGARIEIVRKGDQAQLVYEVIASASRFRRQVNELSMALAFSTLRAMLGETFLLDRVEIASEKPPVGHERLENYFGAPVHYSSPLSSLRFPAKYLDRKIDTSNASLLRFAQMQCDSIMAANERPDDLVHTVASHIRRLLPIGGCSLALVARQIGLHPRTLQNRLMEHGCEFRELVRQERMTLAEAYLRETHTPLAEVALLLGYADQACFTRAFSSWSGKTPRRFRMSA